MLPLDTTIDIDNIKVKINIRPNIFSYILMNIIYGILILRT